MTELITARLTAKDDKAACAFADKIIAESQETDAWYEYFDAFAALLDHPKSLVRNRVLYILAANAQWDEEDRFRLILSDFLAHVTDENPSRPDSASRRLPRWGRQSPSTFRRYCRACAVRICQSTAAVCVR